jgi:predicted SAM-dependent methyltransferase
LRSGPETKVKIDLAAVIEGPDPVILELGCGKAPRAGRIGVDLLDLPGVDIVADLENGLPFMPNASVDEIHCRSLLEHLDNFELVMQEIVRVLKPGGTCHVFVPHFSNPYYYSDYTHKRFFGLYTFYYFVEEKRQLARTVPDFYTDVRIRIVKLRLKFSSPFKVRRAIKKLWTALFNSSRWMQEYYEENLCWKIPCYGLDVVFTPDHPDSREIS